jgi:hypothetical protein
VVLAGGKARPDLIAATGQTNRALVIVNGKTLLEHSVDALRASPLCGSVTVVGDVPESADYAHLPDAGDFVSNVLAGATASAEAPFLLLASADMPFLTGEVVTTFLREALALAQESGAGLIYPVVPVGDCYARFPGVRRTSLRLKEGELTGGNLMLARPHFLLAQKDRLAAAYAARKSPLRLAAMLGPETVLRLLFSQPFAPQLLTIPLLEAQVSRLLGGPARALLTHHPEIATDLDRASDFAAVGLPIAQPSDK